MSHEITRDVEVVVTNLRPISDKPSLRVRQPESLKRKLLFEQLAPQRVASTRVELGNGKTGSIGTYNVISPYTTLEHVMLLDESARYTPTPTEMSQEEYRGLLQVAGVICDDMATRDRDSVISLGYNNTPLNFGAAEMKAGGMQSLPTKHHLQVWNRPSNLHTKPFTEVPENVQAFLKGDALNEFAARILSRQLPNTEVFKSASMQVSHQGIQAELNFSLHDMLLDADGFARFIKEIHARFERINMLVWDALMVKSFGSLKQIAKKTFERGYAQGLEELEQVPMLLSRAERDANIKSLPSDVFNQHDIRTLLHLSSFMKDQKESNPIQWTRKGWGYSLVFVEDLKQGKTTIFLHPGIQLNSSRGGVVEAQGQSLVRSTDTTITGSDIENNIVRMNNLRRIIPKRIIS